MSTKSTTKTRSTQPRGRTAEDGPMDVRLQRRHLRDGLLTRTELDRQLHALEDVSDKIDTSAADAAPRVEETPARAARKPRTKTGS